MPNDHLRKTIIEAIRTVQDPEIPVNLYDLGLIYELDVNDACDVAITMTLTTPNCPVAESMPGMVRDAVNKVAGVGDVTIDLVWDPAWTGERMSEDARLTLEMMGISWREPGRRSATTPLTFGKTPKKR